MLFSSTIYIQNGISFLLHMFIGGVLSFEFLSFESLRPTRPSDFGISCESNRLAYYFLLVAKTALGLQNQKISFRRTP